MNASPGIYTKKLILPLCVACCVYCDSSNCPGCHAGVVFLVCLDIGSELDSDFFVIYL